MPSISRPLVALDIDGVLNPHPVAASDPAWAARLPGYVERDITLPAGTRHLPLLRGHGTKPITGRVFVNPLHAEWIRSLLGRGGATANPRVDVLAPP